MTARLSAGARSCAGAIVRMNVMRGGFANAADAQSSVAAKKNRDFMMLFGFYSTRELRTTRFVGCEIRSR
jgi:hypothetical protein